MTSSSKSPLPRGEGARSAGEGQEPQVSSRGPHPAFGHPLPEGEGPRLKVMAACDNARHGFGEIEDAISAHPLVRSLFTPADRPAHGNFSRRTHLVRDH